MATSPSQPSPSSRPDATPQAAITTPQTLSSLELLSSSHLSSSPPQPHPSPSRRRSLHQEAGFRAINDHGLIGNCRTAALVGLDSCITWYCFPHFDSPSLFGAIVDTQRGGHFSVRPLFASPPYHAQAYEEDTNVLVTTVTNQHRLPQPKSTDRRYKPRPAPPTRPLELAITDYLPMDDDDAAKGMGWLVRDLHCTSGPLSADIQCFPCFDYGRAQQRVELVEGGKGGVRFVSDALTMLLTASTAVEWVVSANGKGVFGRIRMAQGDRVSLIFRAASPSELSGPLPPPPSTSALLARTRSYWRQWMSQCTYRGRWSSTVRRSALALKMLYFAPEGSCVASPTTSLPETLGGVRNWDYRFAWVRDTSFIIATLLRLGFKQEARRFIGWMQRRAGEMTGGVEGHGLQALYGLRGEKELEEKELPHLRGYLHSRPVRVGNGAWDQIQLDIYGEMMETVWLAHSMGAREMDLDLWASLRPCIDWIVAHRQDRDEGVWEVRGGKQSFTYSRLQIWVAVDRAIRLAEELQVKYGGQAQREAGQGRRSEEVPETEANADPSEYGAGHKRSEAVQRALERQRTQSTPAESAGEEVAPASSSSDGAFTVLSPTLTSHGLPASQRMEARAESAAFMSAIDASRAPTPINADSSLTAFTSPSSSPSSSLSSSSSSSSSSASSADLPLELCEGCTIPAPSPNSPDVLSHTPSSSSSSPTHLSFPSPPPSTTSVFPGLLTSDLEWWRTVRTSLFHHLIAQGYNEKRQAFVQHVATPPHPSTCTVLDAACLAFPLYGFLPPNDPRIVSTLNAILAPIGEGGLMQNHLVYRYNVSHTKDGFGGEEEGTFALCSNWAIEGLAKWGRTGDDAALQRAELMMEQMVGLSNHLDLYSEELLLHKGKVQTDGTTSPEQKQMGILKEDRPAPLATAQADADMDPNDFEEGDDVYEEEGDQSTETRYLQIGNFVQGFSHLAFVNAAIELNAGLDEREERLKGQRDAAVVGGVQQEQVEERQQRHQAQGEPKKQQQAMQT